MKLKWSELQSPMLKAFHFYKLYKLSHFKPLVNSTYRRYRNTNPPRNPKTLAATQAFETLKQEWDAKAREACSPEKATPWGTSTRTGLRTGEIRKGISLMYQGKEGTEFGQDAPQSTEIQAIQYDVDPGQDIPARSRLSLVVHPECCGEALRKKLLFLLSVEYKTPIIQQWKVMSPTLGAQGPESAVIYLMVPLDQANTKALICTLSERLRGELEPLPKCPLGLIKLTDGIYGCDIPSREHEQTAFGALRADGSAGQLGAMIICKAAWVAAQWLYQSPGSDQRRRQVLAEGGSEEEFVRAKLAEVLDELGWELED